MNLNFCSQFKSLNSFATALCRKFVDICATVRRQWQRQAAWAHLVTAAPLGGPDVLKVGSRIAS